MKLKQFHVDLIKRLFKKDVYVACYLGQSPEVIGVTKTLEDAKRICVRDVVFKHGGNHFINSTFYPESSTYMVRIQLAKNVTQSYGYRISYVEMNRKGV